MSLSRKLKSTNLFIISCQNIALIPDRQNLLQFCIKKGKIFYRYGTLHFI